MLTADKIQGKIIYEDALCFAYLPINATTIGHIHIVPKQPVDTLEDCSDELAMQLFHVASYAATAVYEGLGSQGTNILCNNGIGQLILHVIPRKEDDGIVLKWKPTQQNQKLLDETVVKIKDQTDILAVRDVSSENSSATIETKEAIPIKAIEEENYMVKHLYRIP